jgi:hypothetical protein
MSLPAPQYTALDATEAAFPAAPLRQARARLAAAHTRPNAYFSLTTAVTDAADASGAYGTIELPLKHLPGQDLLLRYRAASGVAPAQAADMATTPLANRPRMGLVDSDPQAFFITHHGAASVADTIAQAVAAQVAGAATAQPGDRNDVAARTVAGQTAAVAGHSGGHSPVATRTAGAPPIMQPLTELDCAAAVPGNPVPQWHNRSKGARQRGHSAVPRDLWVRSQRRAAYRSAPTLAGTLTESVLSQLRAGGGQLAPGRVPGVCGRGLG